MAKKTISKEYSAEILKDMADSRFRQNMINLLKSRVPLFYVTTNEEKRFITYMEHFSRVEGYQTYIWDSYEGLREQTHEGNPEESGGVTEDLKNSGSAIIDHIINSSRAYEGSQQSVKDKKEKGTNGIVYILLDFFRFIEPTPDIERRLKTLCNINSIVSAVVTGPYYQATETIANLMPVVEFPFANQKEIRHSLYEIVHGAESKLPTIRKATEECEEDLINAVSGLTLPEAQLAFSKSIVEHKDSGIWNIPTILQEKKQIISKNGLLEYFDKIIPIEDIGGLKNLVNWINLRRKCFTHEAENYGLRKPRGLLTIGMSGCGKSLACKAISGSWRMPLLRLDFGRLFGSLVGDSEKNTREAIRLAEAIAPAILWIDEIEKALSGGRSSGVTDGGTTSRVLGTFLTWMQEKESPVFVVATANDHSSIPAEFLRAGRFDEIFFVDLPNTEEREEIFEVLIRKRPTLKRKNFDLTRLAIESKDYSGAEIEKGIDNAMLVGFHDGSREINTEDISLALKGFKPLAVMRADDFVELREWADAHCVKANADESKNKKYSTKNDRNLDI